MPRDECRDCKRPIDPGGAETDGRCPACAAAFKERLAAAKDDTDPRPSEGEEE